MPNMIFPTQEATTESTAEYLGKVNTMDMGFIASRLASLREAGDGKMPAELLEHFKSKRDGKEDGDDSDQSEKDESDEKSDSKAENKDSDDNTDDDFIKKALAEMDTITAGQHREPCVCGEPDCDECSARDRRASNAGNSGNRRVSFTDSDLTEEAIQRDVQAGNHEMVQARLAARQMRRERLAQRIASTATAQAERSQRLAQRSDFRKQVVAEVTAAQSAATSAVAASTVKTASAVKSAYKSGSQMGDKERQIIAQRLAASGEFPQEFIEAALLESASTRSAEEEAGREIMTSTLSVTAKSLAIRQIVANLTPESRNRALDYWIKDLGYGDADWVKDLFSAKYD